MALDHCSILGTTGVVVHILFITLGVNEKRNPTKKKKKKKRPWTKMSFANVSFLIIPTQSDSKWYDNKHKVPLSIWNVDFKSEDTSVCMHEYAKKN